MYVTYLIMLAVSASASAAMWLFWKRRIGRPVFFIAAVALICGGLFVNALVQSSNAPLEQVKVIATGEKNPDATVNEICVMGYNANGEWHNLSQPVEGDWAWFPGTEGASYYYAGWFPGADIQPENATDYIVLEIQPGKNRSVVFLTHEWYGIARVEYNDFAEELDTYGDGTVKAVFLPDTDASFYRQTELEVFSISLGIFVALVLLTNLLLWMLCKYQAKMNKFKQYQFLFEELVKRDFTLKYKRTVLGMVWSILSPLFTLLIMWIVFKDILGSNINHFVIYMYTGQIVYAFFNEATTQGMTSLLDNASIFTKVNVPKYMFLLSRNVSSLINFGLTFVLLIVFVLIDGLTVTPIYIALVYPLICLILFNTGLGLLLSALFVFFRDMQYLWGIFSQLLMWVSAIFYSTEGLDPALQYIFVLNPIYSFIHYFRTVILENRVPTLMEHILILVYTLIALLLGFYAYKKYNHEFLYYV